MFAKQGGICQPIFSVCSLTFWIVALKATTHLFERIGDGSRVMGCSFECTVMWEYMASMYLYYFSDGQILL